MRALTTATGRLAVRAGVGALVAGALVAGALVAGALVVGGPGWGEDLPRSGREATPATVAPDGRELFGQGSLGIALPEEWELGRARCSTFIEDRTVALETNHDDCAMGRSASGLGPGQGWTTVQFMSRSDLADLRPTTAAPTDELEIVEGCEVEVLGVCWAAATYGDLAVVVEAARASPTEAAEAVDEVAAGITALDHVVGIPSWTAHMGERRYTAALERVGLVLEVYRPDRTMRQAPPVVSPPPGTVVPVGSTVTLTFPPAP